MNVIIFLVSFSAVFLANSCTADPFQAILKHRETGFANDLIIGQWEELVRQQNIDAIVENTANDVVYMRQGKGVAYGQEEFKKLYQEWFASGVKSVKVDLIRTGPLGEGYMYDLVHVHAFDENSKEVESSTALVILREVEGGRYEVFLKAETLD